MDWFTYLNIFEFLLVVHIKIISIIVRIIMTK